MTRTPQPRLSRSRPISRCMASCPAKSTCWTGSSSTSRSGSRSRARASRTRRYSPPERLLSWRSITVATPTSSRVVAGIGRGAPPRHRQEAPHGERQQLLRRDALGDVAHHQAGRVAHRAGVRPDEAEQNARTAVVLPAPLGPIRLTTSRRRTSIETRSSTVRPPSARRGSRHETSERRRRRRPAGGSGAAAGVATQRGHLPCSSMMMRESAKPDSAALVGHGAVDAGRVHLRDLAAVAADEELGAVALVRLRAADEGVEAVDAVDQAVLRSGTRARGRRSAASPRRPHRPSAASRS